MPSKRQTVQVWSAPQPSHMASHAFMAVARVNIDLAVGDPVSLCFHSPLFNGWESQCGNVRQLRELLDMRLAKGTSALVELNYIVASRWVPRHLRQ